MRQPIFLPFIESSGDLPSLSTESLKVLKYTGWASIKVETFSEGLKKWITDNCTNFKIVIIPTNEIPEIIDLLDAGAAAVLSSATIANIPEDRVLEKAELINLKDLSLESLADKIISLVKTDRPDGLYSTVVVNESQTLLGFCFSSKESIAESIKTGQGVYHSRERGLWYKGSTSGDTQTLLSLELDCDTDCLKYIVTQHGNGFCHLSTQSCFGDGSLRGLEALQKTLSQRKASAPEGSYTKRLFNDPKLLNAKIMEEADELCTATTTNEIAFECADLIYFALTRCVANGVSLNDVERQLDRKALKVSRRKGDAKPQWIKKEETQPKTNGAKSISTVQAADNSDEAKIQLKVHETESITENEFNELLTRPVQKTDAIMALVTPIVNQVKSDGDKALLQLTEKFDKAKLSSPVLKAPFDPKLFDLPKETLDAIDVAFENVRKFHEAQLEKEPLVVETMPGIICSRFARPITRVGLYVPGGTAILPSTAIMLGVPAMVAGCKTILLASPPRRDGTITPEVVYVAHKIGAQAIVLAGGAQAVAAMAYGTQSIPKVDKILGPGNQFVTAAKMLVQNDTSALVSIDMPAGPSEVLVIADDTSNPAFVASDLLSQAEHGADSKVVLVAVNLSEKHIDAINSEVDKQANALTRTDIIRKAIAHSFIVKTADIQKGVDFSNAYAPEHLILHLADAEKIVDTIDNAGSVFVGQWSPESCGDYASGTNHTLPTYGYARVYSGVNTLSFMKHITSQQLTREGLQRIGPTVMQLADVEGLDAHRDAVRIRLESN